MTEGIGESVIIDAVRSPIGVKGGKMAGMRPDNLLAQVLMGLITRNQTLPWEAIADVVVGCAFPEGPQGMLLARSAATLAGIPETTGGKIVNRFCGASMDAIHQVDRAIRIGDYQLAIAGGVEDMVTMPENGYNPSFHPELAKQNYYISMGESVEILANASGIEREVQEEYAVNSHNKALDAWDNGFFNNEIIPVQYNQHIIARDEGPQEPNLDKMSSQAPAYLAEGSITEATSSPYAIGASALLLADPAFAAQYDLQPRARIISRAIAGIHWEDMGVASLAAAEKALEKAELSIADMDVIELSELFSAQALYVILKGGWPFNKINLNGGAIALGHPWGCSGARMLTTLLNVMDQQDARYGLAAMSVSGGQGIATIIERMPVAPEEGVANDGD